VLFVSFVVRLDFFIEHGNLGVGTENLLNQANFEVLKYEEHEGSQGALRAPIGFGL
jgi:hypothetical protein